MPIITSVNGAKKEINRIIHSADGAKKEIGKMYHGVSGTKQLVYDSRKYGKAEWKIIYKTNGITITEGLDTYNRLPELGWTYTRNVTSSTIEFKLNNTKVKKGDTLTYEYKYNCGTHSGVIYIDFYDGRTTDGIRLYSKKTDISANKEGSGRESLRIESEINTYLNLMINLNLDELSGTDCIYKVYNVYLNGHRIG